MPRSVVEISGHIVDSLILPKVLDLIIHLGAEFEILEVEIGKRRADRSRARIQIDAATAELLEQVLAKIKEHGALPVDAETETAELEAAPADGVLPDRFYATTNLPTWVRVGSRWIEVENPEMDCAVQVQDERARTVPMHRVRKGDLIVVGQRGVKVTPMERRVPREAFEFMSSVVSTEQPKGLLIREIAETMSRVRRERGKILVVAGPGLVHTGASRHLVELIDNGFVQVLFAGNGLAVHDIEQALFGTSLGVDARRGSGVSGGHRNHLRAINAIRRCGGIAKAVRQGILERGIFFECVRHGVPFALAASIRDDGPLPDTLTDMVRAQDEYARLLKGADMILMLGSMLHAIGAGNMTPAGVKMVCVDINPAVATKLADRGSLISTGIVADVGSVLNLLVERLHQMERGPMIDHADEPAAG